VVAIVVDKVIGELGVAVVVISETMLVATTTHLIMIIIPMALTIPLIMVALPTLMVTIGLLGLTIAVVFVVLPHDVNSHQAIIGRPCLLAMGPSPLHSVHHHPILTAHNSPLLGSQVSMTNGLYNPRLLLL